MARIYEGMYLLDNAAVREDWNTAKSIVTGTLEKHGAKVLTARRWGERRLAYPINKRNRATFLLTYFEIPPDNFPGLRRDFELNEAVLRSLELRVDVIPDGEDELNQAELAADFSVPPPPDDSHIDEPEEPERDDRGERGRDDRGRADRPREAEKTEGDKPEADKPEGDQPDVVKAEAEKAEAEKTETEKNETEKNETGAPAEGEAGNPEEAVKTSEES